MYYYFPDEERKVVSSGGTFTEDLFFSRICRMDRNLLGKMEDIGLYAVRAELYEGSSMGMVIICPLKPGWRKESRIRSIFLCDPGQQADGTIRRFRDAL